MFIAFPFDGHADQIAFAVPFQNAVDADGGQFACLDQALAAFFDVTIFGQFFKQPFETDPSAARDVESGGQFHASRLSGIFGDEGEDFFLGRKAVFHCGSAFAYHGPVLLGCFEDALGFDLSAFLSFVCLGFAGVFFFVVVFLAVVFFVVVFFVAAFLVVFFAGLFSALAAINSKALFNGDRFRRHILWQSCVDLAVIDIGPIATRFDRNWAAIGMIAQLF